jgi:hypothetical protein
MADASDGTDRGRLGQITRGRLGNGDASGGHHGAVWCRWWSRGVVAGKRPSPRRRLQAGRWSELGPPGRPFSNPASRWRLSKSET